MNRTNTIAFISLGVIWGSNFITMKWASVYITPGQIVFLRVLFGFLPIILYALVRGDIKKEHFRHWPHFFVMSLLATSLYYYAYAKGTSLLYSGIAGMLSGSIPLFSFVLTFFFLRDEITTMRKIVGAAVGFMGIILIARPWTAQVENINLTGIVYMVLGSLSVACSFVYAKKFLADLHISPVALSTYQVGLALVLLTIVTDMTGITQIAQDAKTLIGVIVGLGLLGTGVAFILYYFIIEKMGAVSASSVTYIPPVVSLFISFFFMREPISVMDVLAMAAILTGVFLLRERNSGKIANAG